MVLTDRTVEDLALAAKVPRAGEEPLGIADAFGRDQDALRIHAE